MIHLTANNTQPYPKTLKKGESDCQNKYQNILLATAFDCGKYFHPSLTFVGVKLETSKVTHLTANNPQPYPKTLKKGESDCQNKYQHYTGCYSI